MEILKENIKILPFEWKKPEKIYGDCRLVSIAELLRFYGNQIEVYDIFGYGQGLNFSFIDVPLTKKIVLIGLVGRNPETEEKFCKLFDCELKVNTFKKIDELIYNIEHNNPIMINLDRYYLDYTNIEKAHFGLHVVLLIGYNNIKKTFYLIDILSDKVEEVDYQIIINANTSKLTYAAPESKWFNINPENFSMIFDSNNFISAVRDQAGKMLGSDGALHQLKNLISFLKKIYKKLPTNIEYQNFIGYQMPFFIKTIHDQEESGTFYRNLYFIFLYKNCLRFNKDFLYDSISIFIKKDLESWIYLSSELLKKNNDLVNQLQDFIITIENIYEIEFNIFMNLREWN